MRGFGPTREAAFEQGAVALMHAIADPDRVEPRAAVEVACEALVHRGVQMIHPAGALV